MERYDSLSREVKTTRGGQQASVRPERAADRESRPLMQPLQERPHKPSYFLSGELEGRVVRFLLDTGCNTNMISKRIFDTLPVEVRRCMTMRDEHGLLADGSKLPFHGQITLSGRVDRVRFRETFVVGDVSEDAILGMAFLTTHQCSINFATSEVKVGEKRVMCIDQYGKQLTSTVEVLQTVTLPPFAEADIMAGGIPSCDPRKGVVKCMRDDVVLVDWVRWPHRDECLSIRCRNPSERSVTLKAGQVLGTYFEIREGDMCTSISRSVTKGEEAPVGTEQGNRQNCWLQGRPTQPVGAPGKVHVASEKTSGRLTKGQIEKLTGMFEEYGRKAGLDIEEPLQPTSGEPRVVTPGSEESPVVLGSCDDCEKQSSPQVEAVEVVRDSPEMEDESREDDPIPATGQPVERSRHEDCDVSRVSQVSSLHIESAVEQVVAYRPMMTEVSDEVKEGQAKKPPDRPPRARMKCFWITPDEQGGKDVVLRGAPELADDSAKNPKRIGGDISPEEKKRSHSMMLYTRGVCPSLDLDLRGPSWPCDQQTVAILSSAVRVKGRFFGELINLHTSSMEQHEPTSREATTREREEMEEITRGLLSTSITIDEEFDEFLRQHGQFRDNLEPQLDGLLDSSAMFLDELLNTSLACDHFLQDSIPSSRENRNVSLASSALEGRPSLSSHTELRQSKPAGFIPFKGRIAIKCNEAGEEISTAVDERPECAQMTLMGGQAETARSAPSCTTPIVLYKEHEGVDARKVKVEASIAMSRASPVGAKRGEGRPLIATMVEGRPPSVMRKRRSVACRLEQTSETIRAVQQGILAKGVFSPTTPQGISSIQRIDANLPRQDRSTPKRGKKVNMPTLAQASTPSTAVLEPGSKSSVSLVGDREGATVRVRLIRVPSPERRAARELQTRWVLERTEEAIRRLRGRRQCLSCGFEGEEKRVRVHVRQHLVRFYCRCQYTSVSRDMVTKHMRQQGCHYGPRGYVFEVDNASYREMCEYLGWVDPPRYRPCLPTLDGETQKAPAREALKVKIPFQTPSERRERRRHEGRREVFGRLGGYRIPKVTPATVTAPEPELEEGELREEPVSGEPPLQLLASDEEYEEELPESLEPSQEGRPLGVDVATQTMVPDDGARYQELLKELEQLVRDFRRKRRP